jgi:glycosyltransferase involved in cell wall biosynthesis
VALESGGGQDVDMRILCVHQGYDLYGSDRCFIESVATLRETWPLADIEVVVPRDGPIIAPLTQLATRVTIEPLLVIRRRGLLKWLATLPLALGPALWRAARRMQRADIVLVNTVVVLDYLLLARFFSSKTVVHVHEIPDGIKLRVFRALLRWTRAEIIFNSQATRRAYALSAAGTEHVVYNGIAAPRLEHASSYEGSRPLRLLMLGRINRIKGQDLLIEALAGLPRDIAARVEVRIVGGSFENDAAREAALRRAVDAAGLSATVRFEAFTPDPAALYRWADIVVVPSRLPESLGRVAIEAMSYARPVIAARIGGLVEIVEDRHTGWLVAPNDAAALAQVIASALLAPDEWRSYGGRAQSRFEALFAAPAVKRQLAAIFATRIRQLREQPVRDMARV